MFLFIREKMIPLSTPYIHISVVNLQHVYGVLIQCLPFKEV